MAIMGPRSRRKNHAWCVQPLTPLMESPDPEAQGKKAKKEGSWEVIRTWVRMQMEKGVSGNHLPIPFHGNSASKKMDLKLILGILGCPLAPIPLTAEPSHYLSIKDTPIETSSARYIIQQYLAATGCLKLRRCMKSMYAAGTVKMIHCETESTTGRGGGANGCFVLWQMSPGMWLMELVAAGSKVIAGSNGKIVWRHLPCSGMNAARGPQRPLRRIVQGLDPKSTASMFAKAQCLGEKRIGDDDCFVLKVSADHATIAEQADGPAEVIRHVLYGYFSQKNGLLVCMEDSHLTKVQSPGSEAIYWETTIGSTIEDYRNVDNVLVAHQGRSTATVFRFSDNSPKHSRTTMEELWRIDDVVFNVPGLSMDCFIPPAEILSVINDL
ncbi:uncharacterized protein LOC103711428 [Phoenix dactylifera]|uniref:Uncharacterized protein LOC103711428 n=1 Tax=Phoenix dactylifera TaxID=42345 RepID=A0A8B7CBL7_PHODC|nr:uncharacterized protein LOC103711428 [Phoenix dactylifera]